MDPILLSGSANAPLARAIAQELGTPLGRSRVERFPDSELQVEIGETIRGRDVYLVQSTSPPAEAHLLELLLMADACRRAGAAQLTAVMPYFGYARQDRRERGREPLGARLIADLLSAAGFTRIVAVDLHTAAVEGCFAIPLEHRSAVPLLGDALKPFVEKDTIVVAPDLGAVKLAERYARLVSRPVVIVHKARLSGTEVRVHAIVGEAAGRAPIIVDDMISTGGTIEAAARALLQAGCRPRIVVAASHLLLVSGAAERLAQLPIQQIVGTDSVAGEPTTAIRRTSLAPMLAETIRRLHENRSLTEVDAHG